MSKKPHEAKVYLIQQSTFAPFNTKYHDVESDHLTEDIRLDEYILMKDSAIEI